MAHVGRYCLARLSPHQRPRFDSCTCLQPCRSYCRGWGRRIWSLWPGARNGNLPEKAGWVVCICGTSYSWSLGRKTVIQWDPVSHHTLTPTHTISTIGVKVLQFHFKFSRDLSMSGSQRTTSFYHHRTTVVLTPPLRISHGLRSLSSVT